MWKTKIFKGSCEEDEVSEFLTSLPRDSADRAKITYIRIEDRGWFVVFYPPED